ncbi:MAG: acetoacetate--CoA ligase [Chloroflexi bacterium]|nr:acetoacetate--CoA ligase [Chloroflexota bacterium]
MSRLQEGDLLWTPSRAIIRETNLERYRLWLASALGVQVDDYAQLWLWSVDHIETFWESLFTFFHLRTSQPWSTPLVRREMPAARWFPGVRLNYAENIFAQATDERPALFFSDERGVGESLGALSWADLAEQVRRTAQALQRAGVKPDDRVAAYIGNIPEAMIAMLATASLGAIWSSCSPDFGAQGVLDRFQQIAPRVLIAVTGYQHNGKVFDRRAVIGELLDALPTVQQALILSFDGMDLSTPRGVAWDDAMAQANSAPHCFEQVPFEHPLWILYSSGTTGLPKPIVHGHGGMLLEHAKATIFHNDLKPGDCFFWYTSTGWMMWNYQIGALLSGASIILYNGSPTYPHFDALFQLAERSGMTYFGTSAAFVSACIKTGIHPNQKYDLSRIRGVGSTGSPLSVEGFEWIYENINRDLALESLSGGTDLCTAFVGGVRTQPIYAGELQGRSLGASIHAYDEAGQARIDEVGELVITQPMPSMPIAFWNDADMSRYRASYFDMYPGVWRHGDWIRINSRGGCVIYGRSDSTINRQGIRMGTAELYRIIESFSDVVDSLIVDLEMLGRESRLLLFVVLKEGAELTDGFKRQIIQKLRSDISPRHVPDEILRINAVPYTLSGKKMEVPIRKILLGFDVDIAVKPSAMRNPETLDFFLNYARQQRSKE